jgi:hypothetical protein
MYDDFYSGFESKDLRVDKRFQPLKHIVRYTDRNNCAIVSACHRGELDSVRLKNIGRLRDKLISLGHDFYNFTEVEGNYKGVGEGEFVPEPSFFVVGSQKKEMDKVFVDEMLRLGKEFKQESVLLSLLCFRQEGKPFAFYYYYRQDNFGSKSLTHIEGVGVLTVSNVEEVVEAMLLKARESNEGGAGYSSIGGHKFVFYKDEDFDLSGVESLFKGKQK